MKVKPKPVIRPAQASDASAISVCVKTAYRRYVSRIGKPPGPMLNDYAQVIQSHQVIVADAGGKIAAVLVLIRDDESILLDNIAVTPEYQDSGLGRKLIELAEAEAREQSYSAIDLYTHELMTENIQFYQKLGYCVNDHRTVSGYRRIYMRKNL